MVFVILALALNDAAGIWTDETVTVMFDGKPTALAASTCFDPLPLLTSTEETVLVCWCCGSGWFW